MHSKTTQSFFLQILFLYRSSEDTEFDSLLYRKSPPPIHPMYSSQPDTPHQSLSPSLPHNHKPALHVSKSTLEQYTHSSVSFLDYTHTHTHTHRQYDTTLPLFFWPIPPRKYSLGPFMPHKQQYHSPSHGQVTFPLPLHHIIPSQPGTEEFWATPIPQPLLTLPQEHRGTWIPYK